MAITNFIPEIWSAQLLGSLKGHRLRRPRSC